MIEKNYNYALIDSMYTCWKSKKSSGITIGTTEKLSADIVHLPIIYHPEGAWPLSFLYSVEVTQYGLGKEAYEFYEKMKKNTESLGSVFDAQPSFIKGNIGCTTDPLEQVIGFMEVSAGYRKRVFIANTELPNWNYHTGCTREDSLRNIGARIDSRLNQWVFPVRDRFISGYLPFAAVSESNSDLVVFWSAALRECLDCRLRGSGVRPSFWP